LNLHFLFVYDNSLLRFNRNLAIWKIFTSRGLLRYSVLVSEYCENRSS
jgi:hypothetical protein